MTNTTETTHGTISIDAEHEFVWSKSPRGSEIWGFIKKSCGTTIGTSGWWRTDDPEKAARLAATQIPGREARLTRPSLDAANRFESLRQKVAESLCAVFGVQGQTPDDFLRYVGEPDHDRALVRINCEDFACLDEVEDCERMSNLLCSDSFMGYGLWVEPINRYSAHVFSNTYVTG